MWIKVIRKGLLSLWVHRLWLLLGNQGQGNGKFMLILHENIYLQNHRNPHADCMIICFHRMSMHPPSLSLFFPRRENLFAMHYRTISKMATSPLTSQIPKRTIHRGHMTGSPTVFYGNQLRISFPLALNDPSPRTDWFLEERENCALFFFKKHYM